jgi:hypothetical protein
MTMVPGKPDEWQSPRERRCPAMIGLSLSQDERDVRNENLPDRKTVRSSALRDGPSKGLRTSLSSMAELGMRSICAWQAGR